jgi:hypothetical protein
VASTSKKSSPDQELVELQRALLSGPTTDVPHAETDPDVTRAFLKRRADQREAYGQFVAESEIYDPMGNSLVFTKGMQVPVEHVEKWDLEATGHVSRVATAEEARKGFAVPDIGAGSLIPAASETSPPATSASSSSK